MAKHKVAFNKFKCDGLQCDSCGLQGYAINIEQYSGGKVDDEITIGNAWCPQCFMPFICQEPQYDFTRATLDTEVNYMQMRAMCGTMDCYASQCVCKASDMWIVAPYNVRLINNSIVRGIRFLAACMNCDEILAVAPDYSLKVKGAYTSAIVKNCYLCNNSARVAVIPYEIVPPSTSSRLSAEELEHIIKVA